MREEPEVPIGGAGLQNRDLVRVGDTVRRPAGPWTVSVQRLLRDLRRRGFDLAPEPRGVDEAGREVLTYIEGRDQGWPFIPDILTDRGAEDLGSLARRLRSALGAYQCPPDAQWQFADGAPGPSQALQHGDFGPWNLLWGPDGVVVGVLDWDFVEPGDPGYDTGHLAWFTVPLMDDERAHSRGFPEPPDRRARLEAFAAGAGLPAEAVVQLALQAQREYHRRIVSRGAAPDADPWRTFFELGLHRHADGDHAWTLAHIGPRA